MNNTIGCVIPFVQTQFILPLLQNMQDNIRTPDLVFLIDNRPDNIPLGLDFPKLTIIIHRPEKPLSVNAAWNVGIAYMIERGIDLISVLNDDLILPGYFFETIMRVSNLRDCRNYGVFCPETTTPPDRPEVVDAPIQNFVISELTKREGWAFTMRTKLAKKIPPIPVDRFGTFCGDDWIYHESYKAGMKWMKIYGLNIYHYVGQTLRQIRTLEDSRRLCRIEKQQFNQTISSH